jgi:hypothetical protein
VSPATKNRYRTALGGLATRLVQRKLIHEHFIRDGGLAKFEESGPRLPPRPLDNPPHDDLRPLPAAR